jgi:hypothetical protein
LEHTAGAWAAAAGVSLGGEAKKHAYDPKVGKAMIAKGKKEE